MFVCGRLVLFCGVNPGEVKRRRVNNKGGVGGLSPPRRPRVSGARIARFIA